MLVLSNFQIVILIVILTIVFSWALLHSINLDDAGGGDAIGAALAFVKEGKDRYVYVWIIWTTISLITYIVGYQTGSKFLFNPSQLLNSINYVFIVPVLATAYVYLLKSITKFKRHLDAVEGGHKNTKLKRHVRYLFTLIFTTLILYSAIQSELNIPSPDSPWVTNCSNVDPELSKCADLSNEGVLFFVMRGINTSLAIGIILSIAYIFRYRSRRFIGHSIVNSEFPGLGPNAQITSVGASLVLIACLGSIVTMIHGVSLLLIVKKYNSQCGDLCTERAGTLLLSSTWLIWLMLTLFLSVISVSVVVWIRGRVIIELRQQKTIEENSLELLVGKSSKENENDSNRLLECEAQNRSIEKHIEEKYSRAYTWPLPAGAGIGVFVSIVTQAGSILSLFFSVIYS